MNVRICYRLFLSFLLVALGSGFNPIQLLAGRSSSTSRCRSTNTRKSILSPEQTTWRNKETFILSRLGGPSVRYAKSEDADDSDDDEEDEDISVDDDWRAFRAKLVMGEKNTSEEDSLSQEKTSPSDEKLDSTSSVGSIDEQGNENLIDDDADLDGIGSIFRNEFADPVKNESEAETSKSELTPLDPSQWAYDSGDVIEQGAVILGGIEQEFGFGLRQQYFHKTVMLVLDHSPMFTKGIILNRPTDLMLEDDINQGVKWRVWFGGDVEGMNAQNPDILCLHSLNDERATKASIPVMKDIQWTTFDNAKVRKLYEKQMSLFDALEIDSHHAFDIRNLSKLELPLSPTFGYLLVMQDGA